MIKVGLEKNTLSSHLLLQFLMLPVGSSAQMPWIRPTRQKTWMGMCRRHRVGESAVPELSTSVEGVESVSGPTLQRKKAWKCPRNFSCMVCAYVRSTMNTCVN